MAKKAGIFRYCKVNLRGVSSRLLKIIGFRRSYSQPTRYVAASVINIVMTHVPLNPTDAVSTAMFAMIGKNNSAPMCEVLGISSNIAAIIWPQPRNS